MEHPTNSTDACIQFSASETLIRRACFIIIIFFLSVGTASRPRIGVTTKVSLAQSLLVLEATLLLAVVVVAVCALRLHGLDVAGERRRCLLLLRRLVTPAYVHVVQERVGGDGSGWCWVRDRLLH